MGDEHFSVDARIKDPDFTAADLLGDPLDIKARDKAAWLGLA